MLQKIENLYLAILRFVVIAVAGLLLVAVVVLGLNSLGAIQSEPSPKEVTPSVSDDSLKQAAVRADSSGDAVQQKPSRALAASDPNQAHFDRASAAIVDFIAKQSDGLMAVDKARVSKIIKDHASKYRDAKLTAAYAKNFAESIERLLKDQALATAARQSSPTEVVDRLLTAFTEQFDEQIAKAEAENVARQREYNEKKAAGMQSMYMAAASFGSFLMIVFLSIIIRIERNLRHLENRAPRPVDQQA